MNQDQAAALRAPFPKDAIGKLPKGGQQLDYVGHAAVTDRLLAVDPEWSWEPVAWAEDGGPLIRHGAKESSLWIRLTVCGVTRIGVGICSGAAFELEKQLVSDALRNAAMRFGVALDLWSRQPLLDDVHGGTATAPAPKPRAKKPSAGSSPNDSTDVDAAMIDTVKAAVANLDDVRRATFDRWYQTRKFAWPWTVAACGEIMNKLENLPDPTDPDEEPF